MNKRVSMNKINDLIYDATERLSRTTNTEIEVLSNRDEYDAIISVNGCQFIVLAKSEVRTSTKGVVLSGVKAVKSSKPIIVVAKYIAKDIAEEFKNMGINYLDLAGNCYIKHEDLVFYITGQKVNKISKTNQSRAFQETGIKLIFNLLADKQALKFSYRKLAERTGVSIGSVSNVMNELEELNYLLKTSDKRVLKNGKELLQRWVVAFHDVLKPRLLKKRMSFLNEFKLHNWKQLNLETGDELNVWGGEPAAAILTSQLNPMVYTIYTSGGWQTIAKKLKLMPDENGTVEIYSMFWRENIIRNSFNNHFVAHPIVVYADLIASGNDRNLEIAEKILNNELQYIK